jgi:phosphoribosylformylglycinamidine cyclo-ligase
VRRIVKDARLELGKVYPELNSAAAAKKKGSKAQASKRPAKSVAAAREAGGEEAQRTLGQVLLTPTRIYAEPIVRLQRQYAVKNVITGMAHITGSGIEGNLCRALPPTLDARVDPESWDVPPVFRFLQAKGNVPEAEMWRVFNMGLGYCVIVKPAFAEAVMQKLAKMGEKVWVVGEVVKGKGVVRMG